MQAAVCGPAPFACPACAQRLFRRGRSADRAARRNPGLAWTCGDPRKPACGCGFRGAVL